MKRVLVAAAFAMSAVGQWPGFPTKGPRGADGKIDLSLDAAGYQHTRATQGQGAGLVVAGAASLLRPGKAAAVR